MQQFASRDLMVSALPERTGALWGEEDEMSPCTACTNNTKTNRPKPKPKFAEESDLSALQEQLRAALD